MITLTRERGPEVVAHRLPRVNLLPPELVERERVRRVQYGLGAAVLAAAGVVGLLYLSAAGSAAEAQESARAADAEHARLMAQTASYGEVTAVHARTAQAEAVLVQALGQEVRYSGLLDDLSTSTPEQVRITSARMVQGAPGSGPGEIGLVSLTGLARTHEDVSVWLETLAVQKGLDRPQLDSATEALLGGQKIVQWSIRVPMTAGALSGRYSAVGGS